MRRATEIASIEAVPGGSLSRLTRHVDNKFRYAFDWNVGAIEIKLFTAG